jgi:protein-disulfide isomerase
MPKNLLILFVTILFSLNVNAQEGEVDASEELLNDEALQMTEAEVLAINEQDIVLGDDNAPVTIVEYASMSCSHCAHFHNTTFDDLKTKYIDTGKVKFVFRDFPLDEPALRGAMLAKCAGDKGKDQFLKFIKTMFSTQQNWAPKSNYLEVLSNIAKLGGMKSEEFEACMQDKELERQVMEGKFKAAKFLEIRSTPSFYINGELHRGAKEIEYLSEAIDAITQGANANIVIEKE